MKNEFVKKNGNSRLLTIFAGWAMDVRPFRNLSKNGYDILVLWDYREETVDLSVFHDYQEICIIAWSFGVLQAVRFVSANSDLPITLCVAVNGTLYAVDDSKGIPANVFDATLSSLSVENVRKFYRRMCGGNSAFKNFTLMMPEREIDELAEELISIVRRSVDRSFKFDRVIVCDKDLIIPTENQLRAWAGAKDLKVIHGSHFPDFSEILEDACIDKDLVKARFYSSRNAYSDKASVQASAAKTLVAYWFQSGMGAVNDLLEVGVGTGFATREYLRYFNPQNHYLWDISYIDETLSGDKRICDAEVSIREMDNESLDAIVSASTIQWFNSPLKFLSESRRVLRKNGMCVISTFVEGTYMEIEPYLSSPLRYLSLDVLRSEAEKRFTTVRIESEDVVIHFDSPHDLLRHIKETGVNATTGRGVSPALSIIRAGIDTLTYKMAYLIARV